MAARPTSKEDAEKQRREAGERAEDDDGGQQGSGLFNFGVELERLLLVPGDLVVEVDIVDDLVGLGVGEAAVS